MLTESNDYKDWKARSDRINGAFVKIDDGNGNLFYLGNFEAKNFTDGANTVHIYNVLTKKIQIDSEVDDINDTWSRVVVSIELNNMKGAVLDSSSTGKPRRLSDILKDSTAADASIYFNVMPNVSNIDQCLKRFSGIVRSLDGYNDKNFNIELAIDDSYLDESPLRWTPDDIYPDVEKASGSLGGKTFSMDDDIRETKIGLVYGQFSREDIKHGLCTALQYQRGNNKSKYVIAAHKIKAGTGTDYMELYVDSDGGDMPLKVLANTSYWAGYTDDEVSGSADFDTYPYFASVKMDATNSLLDDGVYYLGYGVEEEFKLIGLQKTDDLSEFEESPFKDAYLTVPAADWWREAILPKNGSDNDADTLTSIPNITNVDNGDSTYDIGGHACWDLDKPSRFASKFHIAGGKTFARWEGCTFLHSMPDQNAFYMIYMEDYVNGGGGSYPGYFEFSSGLSAGDGECTSKGNGMTMYTPDRAYALEYKSFNDASDTEVEIDDKVIDLEEICLVCQYPYYPKKEEEDESGVKAGKAWVGLNGRRYGSWVDDALWTLPYNENDVIKDPAMIIASLFLDEMTNPITGNAFEVADLNYKSFEAAVSDIEARINVHDDTMTYRDIIEQLTSQMMSSFVLDSFGKPTLVSLRKQSSALTLNTTAIRWDQMNSVPEFRKIPWEDITTVINLKSRFLPEERGRFLDEEKYENTAASAKYGSNNVVDMEFENIDGDSALYMKQHLICSSGSADDGAISSAKVNMSLDVSGQICAPIELGDIITLDADTWDDQLTLFGESHAGKLYIVLEYRHSEMNSILKVKEITTSTLNNIT